MARTSPRLNVTHVVQIWAAKFKTRNLNSSQTCYCEVINASLLNCEEALYLFCPLCTAHPTLYQLELILRPWQEPERRRLRKCLPKHQHQEYQRRGRRQRINMFQQEEERERERGRRIFPLQLSHLLSTPPRLTSSSAVQMTKLSLPSPATVGKACASSP